MLMEDDDGAGGSDARITIELQAGVSYTIHAGFYGGGTGSYTLTVTPQSGSGGSTENLSETLAWWDGEWYGGFFVFDANEPWGDLVGTEQDAHAIIRTREDGTATVYAWSDSYELGTVEVLIDEGLGEAFSLSGSLFDMFPANYGEWQLRHAEALLGYPDMISIAHALIDSDGDWFEYMILLRPWGMSWDDVDEQLRPPFYSDWYMSVRNRPSMLDALHASGIDISHSIVASW